MIGFATMEFYFYLKCSIDIKVHVAKLVTACFNPIKLDAHESAPRSFKNTVSDQEQSVPQI